MRTEIRWLALLAIALLHCDDGSIPLGAGGSGGPVEGGGEAAGGGASHPAGGAAGPPREEGANVRLGTKGATATFTSASTPSLLF